MDQQKLQLLMDKNVPWDANKAAVLDEVTLCTLGSDPAKVSIFLDRLIIAMLSYKGSMMMLNFG